MAGRDGCEMGQQLRQVGSGVRVFEGRLGEDSGGERGERLTLP